MAVEVLRLDRPIACTVVRRVNRFVVEIQIKRQRCLAWINNTGRLQQFLAPGTEAFCISGDNPGKTSHRLFAINEGRFGALIDTLLQMKAFEHCLRRNVVPWIGLCRTIRRSARLGESLIDYWLEGDTGAAYIEVKSAVLRHGTYAMYPDCPSVRGRRHVAELASYASKGGRAFIVFVAALPGVSAFRPNHSADPKLAMLLREAHAQGVQIRAVGMNYDPRSSSVSLFEPDLRVELS